MFYGAIVYILFWLCFHWQHILWNHQCSWEIRGRISWATLTHGFTSSETFCKCVDKKCLMIQTSSTWHHFPMNQSYLVIHQNWTQRIKKIPRVILGLPCLTVNMINMNSEVPFNLDLKHRLLTIISHLILLLASWLMFWRLCPAVSFSVAGFSRYSSVFSLHPVGSLWLLVLLCCHLTRACLSGSISCGGGVFSFSF